MRKLNLYAMLLMLAGGYPLHSTAQQDSCNLQISLLTCTPGDELYATFGHTAIRVKDPARDWVFNYGTFDFNEPDFYLKFVRGKLNYFLSVETFADFAYAYQYEGRGITEQILRLNCVEKAQLFQALQENAQENNRFYKYDFLFDNCTTRAGVIIRTNTTDSVMLHNILPEKIPTFRHMLHEYLNRGHQHWSKLGIDILLGSRIDRNVNNLEAQFLPDYLLRGFDSTYLRHQPIVSQSQVILQAPTHSSNTPLQPFWYFLILFLLLLTLSLLRKNWTQKVLLVADQILFTLTGILGMLLVFMWTGTDHQSCRDNYNLLWAIPTNGIFIWMNRTTSMVRKYFLVVSVLALFLLVGWPFLPQPLNIGLVPIVASILLRAYDRSRNPQRVAS